MKLTITEKKEHKLLSRIEVKGSVEFEGATPTNKDVQDALAKQVGADVSLVVIKKIANTYGAHTATVRAHVYSDVAKLKVIEGVKEKKTGEKKEEAPARA